ncbi:filamentous hemagglutinin family N-terminal domain protein [Cylindrospermum stagnale PCC 7417]|uniref:Filamentous hemagglutinin family N-terminal domain protein n=1 Tax=Cylindrospermum stagnale PCC 7417 TaxID=56107 RepID=K9WUV5_9NOST|nr:CHAT domain-containing protein [Cylindrospermum stagnale]AFZ24155.1 filamentous hemagglutinin family N-terminal domain protein [Cylindrospermum stagnale PCC 7417]
MMPIISLVITVYNRELYLRAAIESILAQTRGDFELLIWDDGSTDSTPEIAREYEKRDRRVRVVVAEHQGHGLALKAAIAQTTAPYIGWVDSDDLLAPTALAETAAVLDAQPEVGWVYTDYLDIDEQDNILSYGYRCLVPYSREELLNRFMTFHFRLIRREVFDLVGGINESLKIAEDYDLCLRLSEVAQVQHIFKPLYYYRTHPESISRQRQQEQIRQSHQIITKAQKRRKLWVSSVAASILPLMLGFLPNFAQAQSITPANDGTGTVINTQGNNIDISGGSLSSDRTNLFHSFSQFGVDANQTANFLSQPSIQNILGRVIGGNASLINGLITVTGGNANLYLINPAGILFGANSSLNVPASFTATTANAIGFDNQQWFNAIGANNYSNLNGNPTEFAFTTSQPGNIFNAGNLGVGEGQNLMLLGGTVINTGTVSAANGKITIMAVPGEKLVRLAPANSLLSLDLPIETKAQINPQPFSPLSLPALLTGGNLNSATGVTVENGEIKLTSTNTPIPTDAGTTIISGQVSVANLSNSIADSTGQINILGDRVALLKANLNASGINGGTVLIGGDYQGQGTVPNASRTFVSSDSVINADGLKNGNGGKVIVWADDTTRFFGTITAKGGNGGLVETSGKNSLDVTGAKVDASAINGQAGTWLLDPTDINIIKGGSGTIQAGLFDPSNNSDIDPATIVSALDSGTNVTITTNGGTGGSGDITLTDSINQTGGGNASLTLTARQFFLNPYGQINMTSTGDLTFNLNQVNPDLTNASTSSIQNAINAIGSVAGNTTINLGAGTYTGDTILINKPLTLNGVGASNTKVDGENDHGVFNISDTGGIVTLNDLAIINGKAVGSNGGGIVNSGVTLNINNVIFSSNSTTFDIESGGLGGAIYNSFGDVTVNNSTFSSNSASSNGGAIYNQGGEGGTVTVNNSTFSGNSATNSGGGIYNSFGDVTVNNSTFGGNSAAFGAGFYAYGGAVNVNSSTFSLNSASSNGGGIYRDIVGAKVTLKNTIAAGNTSPTSPDIFGLLDAASSYNLIGDGTGVTGINNGVDGNQVGTAAVPIDPKLSVLGDYGGSTQTFALLPGSLAIDAGTPDRNITTDQRGISRPQGTTPDIGAFELVGYNLIPTAGSGQSTTVNNNFSTDLQAQVTETGFNKPVSGITVNFNAPSSGATASFTGNTTLTTDSSGIVSIPVTANTVAGSYSVSANSGSLTPANFSLTNNPDVAASIIATGGTPQTTVVNTAFANLLQATVKDQYGNLISNATVNFNAPSSGATANFTGNTTLTTDSSGIVSIPVTANTVAGSYSVSANSGSLTPANFSLTNNPDVAASIIATGGTPQATVVNTAFANSLQATVKDQYGNLISNATVNFNAPSSGATANFTGNTTLTTNSSGVVSIPVTANTVAGSYIVSANSGSLIPANFSLTNNNNLDNLPNPEQLAQLPNTQLPLVTLPIAADNAALGIEQKFTNQFQQYLGITAKTEMTTVSQASDILQKIENATGVKPALIYINFVPETLAGSNDLSKNQPIPITSPSDRLELLVITAKGKPIRKVLKVTRSQILAVAQTFKNRVTDPVLRQDYKDSAKQLYEWLITPIETELQERKINNLAFLMDTGLRSLPIAALYDGKQYLVERYSVGLMPSLSLSDTNYVDIKKAEVLGMGASKFANQNPLPAVPIELKTITPRLWQGKSFLNEGFTLKNLQAQRQQTPFGIIHLATHGEFKPGAPSNSYIQLWDTQLRMDRIRELGWNNPPVQLVVLSACRSALGDENAELGFAGFAIQSGAKSALASLWYVSDEGTLGLMSEFYEQLKTAPIKAEALRQTQVAMLKGQVQLADGKLNTSRGDVTLPPVLKELGDKNLQHPYFWSAFTLIGNPW